MTSEGEMLPDGVPTPQGKMVVAGPPMTGKYSLLLRMAAAAEATPVVISTGDDAGRIREQFAAATGGSSDAVRVVDCVSRQRSEAVEDDETTRYVSSPENLTEIGVKYTDLVEDLDGVFVAVRSLSELLVYHETDAVYRFARVLFEQTGSRGWPAVALLNSSAHDERTIHTLYDLFDTVVETRESDAGRELRVRNRVRPPTGWTEF